MKNSLFKKGIVLTIIVLFIGASIVPLISGKSVEKTSFDPVPDLECYGYIEWFNVEPGKTYTGEFTVENIGDPGSLLDWEILEFPGEWGIWEFTPWIGTGLTPEDGPITVQVEFTLLDWFDDITPVRHVLVWEIVIVNSNNPDDFCIIHILLRFDFASAVKNINQQCTTDFISQNIMSTASSTGIKTVEQSSMSKSEDTAYMGNLVDPTIVSILPSSQTVEQSESFYVSVYIEPGEPIIGASFDYLYFDPALIHANSVTEGNLFDPYDTFFSNGTIDNINGVITSVFGLTFPATAVTDPGYFCNISFTAQQDIGTSPLDLEGVIIVNETGGEVPLIINDGLVIVGGGANNPPNTPSQPSGDDFYYICYDGDYSTSTTDPDGDNISYGWDWDGDLVVDEWTGWYESGENCTVSHFWDLPGDFYVRVKAKDTFENESGWSDPLIVTIGTLPPGSPSNPFPYYGATGVSIDVILSWGIFDPDVCDTLTYDIYFGTNPNPPYIETIGPYWVGEHTWYDPGILEHNTTYYWKIDVCDSGGLYGWGQIWVFTTELENHPPYTPSDPDPPDGATNVTSGISWTGGDQDPGDTVTYDVYFGTTNPPPLIVLNYPGTSYNPGTMTPNTQYFWKIVAWDNHGASTEGPIWSFTTAGPNNPPYPPGNPYPHGPDPIPINATFNWTGGDPDPGDTVTYDVYFGTTSPPPLVASGLINSTYDPGTMNYNTLYYWMCVAWDNHGASTPGPIWDFTTEESPNNPPYVPSNPNPSDGATDVERPPSELSATIEDPDGDIMDIYIIWRDHDDEWITLETYSGVDNGTYNFAPPSENDWIWGNTTYIWSVNVTDGDLWTNETYQYTTCGSRYDVNNDDNVNFQDAGLVWIHRTSEVDYDGIYDVNQDGTVNFQDAGLTWINRD